MAELSQLDGATSCSVCDQSRARGRSAEGPVGRGAAVRRTTGFLGHPGTFPNVELPSGVHREQWEALAPQENVMSEVTVMKLLDVGTFQTETSTGAG